MANWTLNNIPDLVGKTIIVTGGNSGLGYESVKAYAQKGATVILASRSIERGNQAKEKIGNVSGNIEVIQLDLSDFKSIETFVSRFKSEHKQLDILLNNAGIMSTPYFETKDGLEGQMGINYLGHFKLTALLMDVIKTTPKSRVVSVSSMAHINGKMEFDNLLFQNGGYTPMKAYSRSKLANILFAYELQRYFEKHKIDSIALAAHPGVSSTNLTRHSMKRLGPRIMESFVAMFSQDSASGALPQLRASIDLSVNGGECYGPSSWGQVKGHPVKVKTNRASYNLDDAKKLWEESQRIIEFKF